MGDNNKSRGGGVWRGGRRVYEVEISTKVKGEGKRDRKEEEEGGGQVYGHLEENQCVWNAVALQQEFAKQWGMGGGSGRRIPVTQRRRRNNSVRGGGGGGIRKVGEEEPRKRVALTILPGDSQAVVHSKLLSYFVCDLREYVIKDIHSDKEDSNPARHVPLLTLAQRMGLREGPKAPLTEEEWAGIRARCVARGEAQRPCPICHDHYRTGGVVLLSCSHLFHRVCLRSFERHLRLGGEQNPQHVTKKCPMCRGEGYEMRVVNRLAATVCLERSATLIKTTWRGFVLRRWYGHLRKRVPPTTSRKLRDEFYLDKWNRLSSDVVACVDNAESSLDDFFKSIDQSVQASRLQMAQVQGSGEQVSEGGLLLMDSKNGNGTCTEDSATSSSELYWDTIRKDALRRLARVPNEECAICLAQIQPYKHINTNSGSNTGHEGVGKRSIVVLSCTHLFHQHCITSLEQFTTGTGDSHSPSSSPHFSCPVCRSHYTRRSIQL
eukprot:Nk52_evm5s2449 gene=Nk52_evmTU5s2449